MVNATDTKTVGKSISERPAQETSIKVLKALADPTRLVIVRKLAARPFGESSEILCKKSPLSQPTLSHHFQRLVEAGVVTQLKKGVAKNYRLNRNLLERSGINVNKL